MKLRITLISLLLLSLSPLAAQACPEGHNRSLAYIRRDNNRCEGLLDSRDATSTIYLIAFSTSNLNSYPETLKIEVPGTGNRQPNIEVQSFYRNYRLDQLDSKYSSSGFLFPLNTNVLKKSGIPIRLLRATAYINRNSTPFYFPVILGQPSDRYEFVLYSPQRNTFPTFEIRSQGKVLSSNPRQTPRRGQIRFAWKYGDAPAGTYELYIVDGEGKERTFRFQHDPSWL
ncbi:MAG: hypothetical protein F6K09_23545 [Merismopedia sp. SIO2A8]|nr:hypothetical protein [Symploca sp. SIO2B6]NET51574.1 hypothetical protein [Merismopedia sp. SIO2A8]